MEARATAHNLIAAHQGGLATYTSEFNSYYGGPRPQTSENITNLLHVIDALVTIADVLAWVASADVSEESETVQELFSAMRSDRRELLARIDEAVELYLHSLE